MVGTFRLAPTLPVMRSSSKVDWKSMSRGRAPNWPRNLQLMIPLPLFSICIRVTSCKQCKLSHGKSSSGIANGKSAMPVLSGELRHLAMMLMRLTGL